MFCCRPNYFGLIKLITISIAIDSRRQFIVNTAIKTILGSDQKAYVIIAFRIGSKVKQ